MISLLDNMRCTAGALSEECLERILAFANENDVPLDQLDLSPRAKNVLRLNKILTLHQLLSLEEADFVSMSMMNGQCADEIRILLAEYLEKNGEQIRNFQVPEISKKPEDNCLAKALLSTPEGRAAVIAALTEAGHAAVLEDLHLSVRSYNCMKRIGKNDITDLVELYPEGYSGIRNVGRKTVEELLRVTEAFVEKYGELIEAFQAGKDISLFAADQKETSAAEPYTEEYIQQQMAEADIRVLLRTPELRDVLISHISENDIPIENLGLSNRAYHAMQKADADKLSGLLSFYPDGFSTLKSVGIKTIQELRAAAEKFAEQKRLDYLNPSSDSVLSDAGTRSYSEARLRELVLDCFRGIRFNGLHYADIRERCPQDAQEEQLKRAIGKLIREKELEYVDFRCYRSYPSIVEIAEKTDLLSARERDFFLRRLDGETLELIGNDYHVTRERVRQIEAKCLRKLRLFSESTQKQEPFDEEYYAHLYTAYQIPPEFWSAYSGVSERTRRVLSMLFDKGSAPLEDALDDAELDVALKIRISDYLNRDLILLDGRMVKRNRSAIEDHVIRTQCRDNTTFDEFVERYNDALQRNRVADPELCITEAVLSTRMNKIANSRVCLWKQGKTLRYYDVDAGDYEALYEALSLEDYENTEVSTLKFVEEYPDLMRKYDIRDQYELHNLIRKTADKSRYHDIGLQRQPTIRFGEFDRDAAIKELLVMLSPVSADELVEFIHTEYGYGINTLKMTYLSPFARYLVDGVYDMGAPQIPADRASVFREALTEDFYPIKRIAAIYKQLFPDSQEGEVNARSLRELGFKIYSEYVLRNYSGLEEYYTHVLTDQDICTIRDKIRKYSATGTFYAVYKRLKQQHEIFLFEPDRLITRRKLEQFGVSGEEIAAFADDVFRLLEDGEYFNMHTLREKGFVTSLDRLGFEDVFLTEILTEDPRFAWQRVFGSTVLCRNPESKSFEIRDFLFALLSEYESIELDEFLDILRSDYGIAEPNPYKITELVREDSTAFYYDAIMKTIYRDKSSYLSEFDD